MLWGTYLSDGTCTYWLVIELLEHFCKRFIEYAFNGLLGIG